MKYSEIRATKYEMDDLESKEFLSDKDIKRLALLNKMYIYLGYKYRKLHCDDCNAIIPYIVKILSYMQNTEYSYKKLLVDDIPSFIFLPKKKLNKNIDYSDSELVILSKYIDGLNNDGIIDNLNEEENLFCFGYDLGSSLKVSDLEKFRYLNEFIDNILEYKVANEVYNITTIELDKIYSESIIKNEKYRKSFIRKLFKK